MARPSPPRADARYRVDKPGPSLPYDGHDVQPPQPGATARARQRGRPGGVGLMPSPSLPWPGPHAEFEREGKDLALWTSIRTRALRFEWV